MGCCEQTLEQPTISSPSDSEAGCRGLAVKLHKVDFLDWHGRASRSTFVQFTVHTAHTIPVLTSVVRRLGGGGW